MSNFIDKWREIVNSDSIEHLNIPRSLLFGWGTMILILQTLSILMKFEVFLQFAGWGWLIIFFLFRQYIRVWMRFYSPFWPILVHVTALAAAIFIKARYF